MAGRGLYLDKAITPADAYLARISDVENRKLDRAVGSICKGC